jgi:hypothetical protein
MSTNKQSIFNDVLWSIMLFPAGFGSIKSIEALSNIGVMPFISATNFLVWCAYTLPIFVWICSCFIKEKHLRHRLVGAAMVIYSIFNIVDAWMSTAIIPWIFVLFCSSALLLPVTRRVEVPLHEA